MDATVFHITPTITSAGMSYAGATPSDALSDLPTLLARIGRTLQQHHHTEGLVLVDRDVAAQLRIGSLPSNLAARLEGTGWGCTAPRPITSFFGKDRPTVHVGQLDLLDRHAFPWGELLWPGDMVAALQYWHQLTGVAWQGEPPVMGLETMRQHLGAVRIRDERGGRQRQIRPLLQADEGETPPDAVITPWSPDLWQGPAEYRRGRYLHAYDRRRAGLTAAGSAKLAVGALSRGFRKFNPSRAGWWFVTVPAWNHPHMPHPLGPVRPWTRAWVTTADMDLTHWVADEFHEIDPPEVIDSMTGIARPLLRPWAVSLEAAYHYPDLVEDDASGLSDTAFDDCMRPVLQAAVKASANAGIGMLGKAIQTTGPGTIWRPDWFAALNATKRAAGWRRAWQIGKATEAAGAPRWPAYVDDDAWWYASDNPDGGASNPGFDITSDKPGSYRLHATREKS